MGKMYGEQLSSHKDSLFLHQHPDSYCWWKKVPNNHLTCMKPCKEWDIYYHINWCPTEALVLDVQLCRDLEPVLIFLKEAPLGIHQAGNKGGPPRFPRKTGGFVLLVFCWYFWSTASLLSCWDVLGGLDDFWKAQRSDQVMIYDGYLFFGAESSYQESLRQGSTGWKGFIKLIIF